MYLAHSLRIQGIKHGECNLIHLLIAFICLEFLNNNYILLINRRYKILRLGSKECSERFECIVVLLMLGLHNKDKPSHIRIYMELLGSVIYIDKKEVVKQEILDEIILVKSLLVRNKKILYLECGNLAYHIHIVAAALN